jgi:hypothetical protein
MTLELLTWIICGWLHGLTIGLLSAFGLVWLMKGKR